MSPLSVAAAQTVPVRGDVDANVRQHLRLAAIAAEAQAKLVVFPELSLTGYEVALGEALAFTERDERLLPLCDAAAELGVTLIVGAPVRAAKLIPGKVPGVESRLHIGALVLAPDRTVALYTKRRLGAFGPSARADGSVPPPENTAFQPGDLDPPVRVGEKLAAIAVCADIGDAAHPCAAAERGATIYLAGMFIIPSEFAGDVARLRGYAVEHRLTVVMANYGGPTGGLRSAGRSAIWSHGGDCLAELGAAGCGVVVATKASGGWSARSVEVA